MGRGLETLAVFARFCHANDLAPGEIYPVATSAIRDAVNQAEFLHRARDKTGLVIEVLSAEDEARYGYVAAINTSTLVDGVVMDLGGGSMQLVQVAARHAEDLRSFRLGAVRMTEQFLAGGGAAKKKDLQKVRAHVREALADVDWLPGAGGRLVARRRRGPQPRRRRSARYRGARPRRPGLRDHPRCDRRARRDAGRAPGLRARLRSGYQARARATSSSPRRSCSRPCSSSAGSTGSRSPRPACATACSWPARCSPAASRCSTTSARRRSATWRSSTRPTSSTPSTWPSSRSQMHDSLVDAGLFEPQPRRAASCCGRPRCSTTSG